MTDLEALTQIGQSLGGLAKLMEADACVQGIIVRSAHEAGELDDQAYLASTVYIGMIEDWAGAVRDEAAMVDTLLKQVVASK